MAIINRYNEPLFPAQKPLFEKVAFQKGEEAVDNGPGHRRPFFAFILLGEEGGIDLHFVQKVLHRAVGGMNEWGGMGNDSKALAQDLFMDRVIRKSGRLPVVEP